MTVVSSRSAAEVTLLRAALRHRIVEPNVEAGFGRLTGGPVDETAFHAGVARCLVDGLIRDPIRLPEGALQCHWHLDLTPPAVEAARQAIDGRGG